MRWALATALVLLIAVSASLFIQAWAHSIYVYEGRYYLSAYYVKGYTPPLYFVTPPGPPAYCGDAVRYSTPYNASFTALGYAFTLQNGSNYLIEWPALLFNLSTGGYLGLYMPSGTLLYSGQVSPLSSGQYYAYYYTLSSPVTSTTSYLGQVDFSPTSIYPGVWFIYSWNLTLKYPTEDVLSFVDGQSYQTTMVYQGVNDYYTILFNTPYTITNYSDPYDLSGSAADNYWGLWYPNAATQPVMLLTPAQQYVAGAVAWSYSYKSGKNVTVVAVVTFSNSSAYVGHGVTIYLFMKPYGWSVSSKYNESTNFVTADEIVASGYQPPSPVMGDVIYFGTSAYALAVEWDPYWAYVYSSYGGASGPWNVWVYEYYKGTLYIGPYPSPNLGNSWAGWDGYGSWSPAPWFPNAGDYVLVCVTYDATHNMLYGFAQDLDNPFLTSSFSVSLSGYLTPPGTGKYAFGVGASTNTSYANWALVYANIS